MSEWKQKRFWTEVTTVIEDTGFAVALDGRKIKTPAKAPLVVPTHAMAQAIAAEWEAQGETVDPLTMPFTRSANAAIDKVTLQFTEVADMLAEYGDSDLLCYRADSPAELVALQCEKWDVILDWAADTLGARLEPRHGVMHQPQNSQALETLRALMIKFSPFELAAFHDLVGLSGSLILGFAATHHQYSAHDLWDISRLDEHWQEDQWGADEWAEEAETVKKSSFEHALRFFDACQDPG